MLTTTLTVTGMHCGSCGILIDEVLAELTGVHASTTDVGQGRTVVEHNDDLDVATLVAAIAEAGYAASV